MGTDELLVNYALLMNRYGADSYEANRFFEDHKRNQRFAELAEVSRSLKKALSERTTNDDDAG